MNKCLMKYINFGEILMSYTIIDKLYITNISMSFISFFVATTFNNNANP